MPTDAFMLPSTPFATVEDFLAAGGGQGLLRARELGPMGTIAEVTASGLRGRGGAGFPVGTKWASVRSGPPGRRYVVANGAEGEPATFKDRTLMLADPYRVVEGTAIAALAVGATEAFIATKASYRPQVDALGRAVMEMGAIGLLGDLSITLVEGPDDYLFGEEKALLEVVEGRRPLPRLLPPWQHGLFATAASGGWESETPVAADAQSNPTLVNNVESLTAVAHVMARGATWFAGLGTADTTGHLLVTIVGDVVRSGVLEVPAGTPLSALLERCGGPLPGRRFRAALLGVSGAVLSATDFDVALSHDAMQARGTSLGSAGFAIYDDRTDMTSVAREVSRFLAVESCGQCPACKGGTVAITDRLLAIETGNGRDLDVAQIRARLQSVTDANRCYLGAEEQAVVSSILRTFPQDIVAHLDGTSPPLRAVMVPLVKDISPDGVCTYDLTSGDRQP